jgi:hypothetical protein
VLEQRPPGERNFVIADKVMLTCDLGFVCLTSRRYQPAIAYAFAAMQAVWDATPVQPMPEQETSARPLMTADK